MPEPTADDLLDGCDNLFVLTPEMKIRAARDQKEHLEVIVAPERTYLIVTAVHKDKSRNIINRITCKNGIPISGYTYDAQSDTYHVECSDYLHMGYIAASFFCRMPGTRWATRVPMHEAVLRKFMTNQQKRDLKNFKTKFKVEDHHIEFIQMIDPNG